MSKQSTPATILVVEDDQALNDAYRTILASADHTVLAAFNGQEALEILQKTDTQPDIILLDLRMPVLDGVGFLNPTRIQRRPWLSLATMTLTKISMLPMSSASIAMCSKHVLRQKTFYISLKVS
jgi:CheY-like chemotaxis protein